MWRRLRRTRATQEWDERHDAPVHRVDDVTEAPLPPIGGQARLVVTPSGSPARLPLDGLLVRRDSDVLLVVLHGALDRSVMTLPRFEWFRTLAGRGESLLFLTDSGLRVDPELGIGWYTGTAEDDLVQTVSSSVGVLAGRLGVDRVAFTGSSAGGFGSLALAARVPHSLAVPFSPQTRIGAYYATHVERFRSALFPGYPDYDAVEAAFPDRLDLTGVYRQRPDTAVWYVQNTGDGPHRKRHLQPFATAVGAPAAGGDSDEATVHVELVAMGDGHVPPPRPVMGAQLDAALQWWGQRG